jgi:8-oxo-dGTP diphosphatase
MINVTCAVIRDDDDRILAVQRGQNSDHPLKWEFPGGKIDEGENEEECIIREISEELSMDIIICGSLPPVEYDYGHKKVRLIPFICDTLDDLPLLTEHVAFRWLQPGELDAVDFCEADVIVAGRYLENAGKYSNLSEEKIPVADISEHNDTEMQSIIKSMMSTKEAEWLASTIPGDPGVFRRLLSYSFSTDRKLAFHSSWTLTKVCDKNPEIVYPYLPEIITSLSQLENESAERSFLRIISFCDFGKIDRQYHGILAEHCFNSLRSGFSAVAIKAYAMEILYRLAVLYPELTNELAASINMLKGEGSAGILARGRIILKKLAQ